MCWAIHPSCGSSHLVCWLVLYSLSVAHVIRHSLNNNPYGVDFQYEWEPVPNRYHDHTLAMKPFYMDKRLVTQGDFAAYLKANPAAMPVDVWHFLGQGSGDVGRGSWDWSGGTGVAPTPYPGNESLPVTYVTNRSSRAMLGEWTFCPVVNGTGHRRPHPPATDAPLSPEARGQAGWMASVPLSSCWRLYS